MKVAVVISGSDSAEKEIKLATDLDLPSIELPSSYSPREVTNFDYLLAYNDSKLVLQTTGVANAGELCVDFSDAKLNYRVNSSIRSQNIAKALGIKGSLRPAVLDATAGLGKDAFLMASLGCEVSLLERSAVVHALLADGLARTGYYGEEIDTILRRMKLYFGDLLVFAADSKQFDVVYLDPMFPRRRKSAKVKKDMAALQQLLGHQTDGAELLDCAKLLAKKRVVVKRAKLSPHLGSDKPDIEFKGSSSRYDVYLIA
ncbi:MAG: class I SAM-dependent methyltransferase [Proteobacteria bacterium]|nr:class I SAM-dependent methyltransferase [Pseudomonadota bacterium]MDA1290973.1 class I SAM-dependent methyltransferase [Pseudomonadota bacterium]